jgi:hypothetical protein
MVWLAKPLQMQIADGLVMNVANAFEIIAKHALVLSAL